MSFLRHNVLEIYTAGSFSPTAMVNHQDWHFGRRLAEGESAIIYKGKLMMLRHYLINAETADK